MAALDWLQSLLGGGQYGDPSTPAMSPEPFPVRLKTGGALGEADQPAGWNYTDYVAQHLQDVASGKVANEGALGSGYKGDSLDRLLEIVGGVGPGAIRAFHGSPHSFDRFDLSKIGTGEGAQAYGHGLYFAENEGVARQYRDTLAAQSARGGVSDRVAELGGKVADLDYSLKNAAPGSVEARALNEQIRAVEQERRSLMDQMRGHMYEVNINAEPHQFLDWDKSLAGQSPEVLDALQQRLGQPTGLPPGYRLRQTGSGDYMVADDLGMGATGKGGVVARGRTPEEALRLYLPSGGEVYRNLAQKLGGTREQITSAGSYDIPYSADALASQRLREAGIPGIRYLDQGSRGAGTGTSNYTVFDDKLIEIMRKFGILPPVAAGGGLLATRGEPPT